MKEEYYVKLQGKANIPDKLTIGHNYKITADCSITQEQRDDNEDGSVSVTYKLQPVTIEINTPLGARLKAKDTRRNSQKLRNYLFKHYASEGFTEDFDQVYDAFTMEVLLMTPQLLREAIKRIHEKEST